MSGVAGGPCWASGNLYGIGWDSCLGLFLVVPLTGAGFCAPLMQTNVSISYCDPSCKKAIGKIQNFFLVAGSVGRVIVRGQQDMSSTSEDS